MCGRKSENGFKCIVALFVLFAVLVSPCCAASSWAAFFTNGEPESEPVNPSSSEVKVKEQVLVEVPETEGSSQTPCTTPSAESKTVNSTISEVASANLEKEFTAYLNEVNSYVNEVESLKGLSGKLQSQLEAFQKTEAISESEYQSVKASLLSTVEANEALLDQLAGLENEAKTKAYALGGAFIGFEDGAPLWGLSGTLGVRFGKNVMSELGVDYTMGNFKNLMMPTLSLDNLRVRAQVGWMW